jgi:hypothetical protein
VSDAKAAADEARRTAINRRLVLDQTVSLYRDGGIIARPVTDIGELLDIAAGRGAFVRALGCTPAWPDLVAAVRDDLVETWLTAHRLDTPWIREWLQRVSAAIAERSPGAAVAIDSIVLDQPPHPDTIGLLSVLSLVDPLDEWTADEMPPCPALEQKEQFLARMVTAWERRADAVGGASPRKRAIETHARWCARLAAGDTLPDILGGMAEPPDRSTVTKAVKSFAAFIEIQSPLNPGVTFKVS